MRVPGGRNFLNRAVLRLPKGLVASSLAQTTSNKIVVICATLEESARWAAQLEMMGWKQVFSIQSPKHRPTSLLTPNQR